jgi:hypothetical protein
VIDARNMRASWCQPGCPNGKRRTITGFDMTHAESGVGTCIARVRDQKGRLTHSIRQESLPIRRGSDRAARFALVTNMAVLSRFCDATLGRSCNLAGP